MTPFREALQVFSASLRKPARRYGYRGLKIFTSLPLRFQDFQRELRERWESFDQIDKQLIQHHLAEVIEQLRAESGTGSWFIVWVPLRKRHTHYDGSIIEYYPGDDQQVPDFILDDGIEVKLGQLLPLLRGLKAITVWQPSDDQLDCRVTIRMSEGAVRRQFHNPIAQSSLQGKILLTKGNDKQQIEYAGFESLLPDELFTLVRQSEYWPKSYERNRLTGKEQKVEDKAKPHLAVVICQRKTSERASCHNDWAVFLPLGTYTKNKASYWLNSDDRFDTQVFIHGYFFIDAGRVNIHGIDEIGNPICKTACKTFQGPGEKSVEKFPPQVVQ